IHLAEKDFEKAHQLCKDQLAIYEKADNPIMTAVVHNMQANIFAAQKDIENAEKSLEKAIAAHPDYLPPYDMLAKIALSERDKEKA
ncbi:MAG: tetratricopeptide repeat protein, partial [Desulfotignum sp.]